MATRFICQMKTYTTTAVPLGGESDWLDCEATAVTDPERVIDTSYSGVGIISNMDTANGFTRLSQVEGGSFSAQFNGGVWKGRVKYIVNKESQPGAVTVGINMNDYTHNLAGGCYPYCTIPVIAPPPPTTKVVTVESQGISRGGPVPLPFKIRVDGVIVYDSTPTNPILPAGGGWGQW